MLNQVLDPMMVKRMRVRGTRVTMPQTAGLAIAPGGVKLRIPRDGDNTFTVVGSLSAFLKSSTTLSFRFAKTPRRSDPIDPTLNCSLLRASAFRRSCNGVTRKFQPMPKPVTKIFVSLSLETAFAQKSLDAVGNAAIEV